MPDPRTRIDLPAGRGARRSGVRVLKMLRRNDRGHHSVEADRPRWMNLRPLNPTRSLQPCGIDDRGESGTY